MKSPEQRGHYGALCLYQIIVPCKIRMKAVWCATRRSGGISVDDCAKTEILVCAFGADSGPGATVTPSGRNRFALSMVPGCAQASNAQTPILVRSQSPIKMPAEVADFPLYTLRYASDFYQKYAS